MMEVSWRHRLGPPVLAVVTLVVFGSGSLLAAPAVLRPTAIDAAAPPCSLRELFPPPTQQNARSRPAWYATSDVADETGALTGYTVRLGASGTPERQLSLPAESFVTGPFGGTLLYGRANAAGSEVHAVRAADGCDLALFSSTDVVRRATLDASDGTVYYHAVDRATRQDLGIFARSLGSPEEPVVVMPPLALPAAGDRFGRTFSTEFQWSPDRSLLAVQSCGELHCRTRVVDRRTRGVRLYDAPGQGELIGLTNKALVTYGACSGFPCPISATDLETGSVSTLAEDSVTAVVTPTTGGGADLVYERAGGAAARCLSLDRPGDCALPTDIPSGSHLLPPPGRSLAAFETAPGALTLVTDDTARNLGPDAVQVLQSGSGTVQRWNEVSR